MFLTRSRRQALTFPYSGRRCRSVPTRATLRTSPKSASRAGDSQCRANKIGSMTRRHKNFDGSDITNGRASTQANRWTRTTKNQARITNVIPASARSSMHGRRNRTDRDAISEALGRERPESYAPFESRCDSAEGSKPPDLLLQTPRRLTKAIQAAHRAIKYASPNKHTTCERLRTGWRLPT